MYISDVELASFFAQSPLYSKISLFEDTSPDLDFNVYDFFDEKAFKCYCEVDKEEHTFKIQKRYGNQLVFANRKYDDGFFKKDGTFSYSFDVTARCQFCNSRIDFLLNIFTIGPRSSEGVWPTVYLRKAGQLPALKRKPENEIYNYLTEIDKELYTKALSSINNGYGIGGFAYLRRIVENEIKRIVKDISELEYENAEKVKDAYQKFLENHQMSNLLDSIYPFLPSSLKELGKNPLKILYQQTSEGIHEMSEEECLSKAQHIDKIIQYVIRRVSSLKNEYQQIREALRLLGK